MENKEFQTLIISLIVHGLIIWALFRLPSVDLQTTKVPVEIVIEEPSHHDQKTFVPETKTPDDLLTRANSQAKFLSKLTQRVREEMKARLSGPTENRRLEPTPPGQANSKRLAMSDLRIQDGEVPGGRSADETTTGIRSQIRIGQSSLGEYIPNLKEGSITALNTDQFTYYSFFARVGEAIRYRWVQRVRNFVGAQSVFQMNVLARQSRTTEVEITLASQGGAVVNTAVVKSSGYPELDRAAIEAFLEASPLQNPPAELAGSDGTIRLQYGFRVEFAPTAIAGP